jgi:MinD-like ATPase involved in chromosome partitioning or flagellar assembly
MSSIVTFYSYKGGVGRSMALANIAVLLARRGLKVLAVDWDLEAPGLERYFSYFEIRGGAAGLLRMCMEARDNGTADYTSFTSTFECEAPHPVTLLASGRETDESYTRNLEAFDWEEFFGAKGGAFVEELRKRWRNDFDVVLIDSRTGLSDTGGICTIQLPDIVVGMFTANFQSLYGVRDVMRLAQQARQNLAYDRMPLSVLPLPTRWGVQEFQETQVWLDRVTEAVQEFFADWLPRGVKPRDVIEAIKVPQRDFFGFGERLAVVEQGTTDPSGMGFVYDKIASFIASDFANVGALVGEQKAQEAVKVAAPGTSGATPKPAERTDYLYDIFVSYDTAMADWVLDFVEGLKAELKVRLSEPPSVFIDVQEIRAGELWADKLSDALIRSKVLLAFITPRYVTSRFASNEFRLFSKRARATGQSLIVPVVIRGEEFPDYIEEIRWVDMRRYPLVKTKAKQAQMQHEIQRVAEILDELVAKAPPFDPTWRDLAKAVYADDPS